MDDSKIAQEEAQQLAMKLLHLEEQMMEYRELHEQEMQTLQRGVNELRSALVQAIEVKSTGEGDLQTS